MTLLQPELVAQLAADVPRRGGMAEPGRRRRAHAGRLAPPLQPARPRACGSTGVGRGDRVGLLIGNEEPLEWLVSYLAIHKAGAVAVPLLARLGPVELARILQDAGASVALCSEVVPEVRAACPDRRCAPAPAATCAGTTCSRPTTATSSPAYGPDDVADIMYTSGTTGQAQGGRRPPRRPLDDGPGAVGLARPRLPLVLALRHDQRLAPRLRTAARRPERVVPAALRRGRAGSPPSSGTVPSRPSWCRPWWSSSSPRPRFATADLSSLAVVTVGSAPIAAATLRRFGAGLPEGRGPLRLRHDRIRRRDGHADGRRRAPPRVGRASRCPASRSGSSDPDGATLPAGRGRGGGRSGDRPARSYLDDPGARRGHAGSTGGCAAATSATSTPTATCGSSAGRRRSSSGAATTSCPARWRRRSSSTRPCVEAAVAGVAHPVLGEDVAAWVVLRDDTSADALRAFLLEPVGRLQGAPPDYRGRRAPPRTRAARSSSPASQPGVDPRVTTSFTTLTRRGDRPRPAPDAEPAGPPQPADAALHPRAPRTPCEEAEADAGVQRHRHPQHRALVLLGLRLHRRGHRSR